MSLNMKKNTKEWYINAPWGKIAMISWGKESPSRILLIHGRLDSAATFEPLLELLPENYYVAFDLPGHGKSDPFPIGVTLTRMHFIGAMDVVVKHLKWDKFTLMGHSMGAEVGLFYNVVYPGQIKRLILLDPGVSLQRLQVHDPKEHYSMFYANYYDNYDKHNFDDRVYSKRRALEAVMSARGLTERQAEIVLSRNLTRIGDDQYKLSWDRRLRQLAAPNYPVDYYHDLFTISSPPTLIIAASNGGGYKPGKEPVAKLLAKMKNSVKQFKIVTVEGVHDVHLTNPERIIGFIIEFLDKYVVTSKL